MDEIHEFKSQLREELLMLPASEPYREKHIMVRCPYCGDSIKHFDHGHLGIKIDMNDDTEPIMYKCLRCDTSGILTDRNLLDLSIDDITLRKNLTKYNMGAKIKNVTLLSKGTAPLKYSIKPIISKELAKRKLEYINYRLGINETEETYNQLRVVFNLVDFLVGNKINRSTRSKDILKILHEDYIGFLTCKKEMVVCRDITNSHELRYDIYKIIKFKDAYNLTKLYTLPFNYNVLSTETFNIHIAEGPLDVLGIYFNINNRKSTNDIYIGVCGCGFLAAFKYLIDNGVFGDNIHIHLYSDNDKKPYFYKKIFKKIKPYFNSLTLYYNELSKDCGVSKNKIKLNKTRIL